MKKTAKPAAKTAKKKVAIVKKGPALKAVVKAKPKAKAKTAAKKK